MPHNKTVPQVKGNFLLGNLSQMIANPFQALCDWQRDYGDLVSFRLATRQFYLFSHPKLIEQALIKQSDVFVKILQCRKTNWPGIGFRSGIGNKPGRFMAKATAVNAAGFSEKQYNYAAAANRHRWQQYAG